MTEKDKTMMNTGTVAEVATSHHDHRAMEIAAAFKAGMRRHAAGVTLITTSVHDSRFGLVATAVNSVSTEPPTLLVCVNKSASAHDAIEQSGAFCVNVLGIDGVEIASQFANSARRAERFSTGTWIEMATGSPVLMEAMASFDCTIVQRIPYGSHTIFLGEVRAVHVADESADPLVYVDRGYKKLLDT